MATSSSGSASPSLSIEEDSNSRLSSSQAKRFVVEAVAHEQQQQPSSEKRLSRVSLRSVKEDDVMEQSELDEEKIKNNTLSSSSISSEEVDIELADSHVNKPAAKGARRVSLAVADNEKKRDAKMERKRSSFLLNPRPLKHYLTREVLPHVDHYRNRMSFGKGHPDRSRPTLDELLDERTISRHDATACQSKRGSDDASPASGAAKGKVIKFGWFEGVYMRCLLNIWGVMLFLRLTVVIGNAGLIEGLAIITLSNVVTTITSISMSAVSTNGQIKAGGIYYMISRSLGPEFGGAIGLMFTIANAIAVSVYLIGFCESMLDMLGQYLPDFHGIIDAERINDIRLIGSVSLVLILGLAIVGMDWVTRVQMGLLFLLLISQVDFIIGTFLPPTDEERSKGFVGYDSSVLKDNLWSQYGDSDTNGEKFNFFTMFAVFFPAVTGIVAGANLSGDLKDPGSAIPKGTLLAIGTTYVTYIAYGIMVAGCAVRYASGVKEEVHFDTALFNSSLLEDSNATLFAFDDCENRTCTYGLIGSQQMMEVISAWGPLIYAGCFAATLSSAIASLVGAPRVFQAVAKDKLFPGINSFAEGWGANNDPVRGYILVFLISLLCILIGNLNIVSKLLSNFFVAAYALINFSVFHATITNSPGWRPSFKYYNEWVSLLGTILCIVVMFLMSYQTALVTFICVFLLYMYVYITKPKVNWGSSAQSQSFITALKSVQSLTKVEDHVKNYRPKLLVFSGSPGDRPCLMDFANLITKRLSLLTSLHVVATDKDYKRLAAVSAADEFWLEQNHMKAFHSITKNDRLGQGVRAGLELIGLGKLKPNMVLIGFKHDWRLASEKREEYVQALLSSFDMRLGVAILHVQQGLDISELTGNTEKLRSLTRRRRDSEASNNSDDDSDTEANQEGEEASDNNNNNGGHKKLEAQSSILDRLKKRNLRATMSIPITDSLGNPVEEDLIQRMTQFRNLEYKEGTIDIYWLFDDGGLTLLLPYILTTRSKFSKCKLRIFFLSDKIEELDSETRNMATLLSKFRIDFQDLIVLNDVSKKPSTEMREEFKSLISVQPPEESDGPKFMVSESDLRTNSERTNFHLRMTEIVRENSGSADATALIVMTLPLPKRKLPQALYLAWLEVLARGVQPPFLFVRGNQESVLTYYS